MAGQSLEETVRNIDLRLERVEQVLPTLATKDEVREEGERTRRHVDEESERTRLHFNVVAESIKDEVKLIAEGYGANLEKANQQYDELRAADAGLDQRVMRLETRRRR